MAESKQQGYKERQFLAKTLRGILFSALTLTGQPVVIKRSRKGRKGRGDRENPGQEIEKLRRLNCEGGHPSVVRIIEAFETADHFVLVMEKLNSDLYNVVADKGRLCELDAHKYLTDITSGLEFIHGHGIAHRDISLENLLLSNDGKVVITDFGLCCDCADGEMQKGTVGKDLYVAPEVFAGDSVYDAKKADVWSLGIVLFTMMTGIAPFELPSIYDERFLMIKQGKLADMLRQWQMLAFFSNDCLDLLSKMLCVEPEKRISLEQVLEHPWVVAKQVPDSDKTITVSGRFDAYWMSGQVAATILVAWFAMLVIVNQ
jgi:calcium-dependent protein kinase